MRNVNSALILAACGVITACATLSPQSSSVESRLAAQNALFEQQYQSDLKADPERATSYGDYRYNEQLDDYSLEGVRRRYASDQDFLARLMAISTSGFPAQDVMSHQVLVRTLQQRIDNHAFKEYEMPLSQMEGPHVHLADLPLAVPLDSVKHYEDYIARLHQIPRAFTQTEQVLRAGMQDHLMPVRFLLEKVPAQCEGVIAADPFLRPTRNFPSGISPEDQQRLTKAITDTVVNEVLPAYHAFGSFVATEYAPHGRTVLAVTSLPDGERRYRNDIRSRTSVDYLSAEQIHQLGLREIDRIEAEMLVIAQQQGFSDRESYHQSLKDNPRYRPVSAEQIVDVFRGYLEQMQPKLPSLFGFIPPSPVTVEAIRHPRWHAAGPGRGRDLALRRPLAGR
jgi:uncharacterized protein (DUF885 family)